MAERYQSNINRNGIPFGYGTDTHILRDDHTFLEMPTIAIRRRALELAWSNGCPVSLELTDPENPDYGPKAMMIRYAQANRWFNIVLSETQRANPILFKELWTHIPRRLDLGETVGKHEPQSVPQIHTRKMVPMASPFGFALSRVPIEYVGRGDEEDGDKVSHAMDMIATHAARSKTPKELLAKVAEEVASPWTQDKSVAVLRQCLSAVVSEEENCQSIFIEIAQEFRSTAPNLWGIYTELSRHSPEVLEAAGIVVLKV